MTDPTTQSHATTYSIASELVEGILYIADTPAFERTLALEKIARRFGRRVGAGVLSFEEAELHLVAAATMRFGFEFDQATELVSAGLKIGSATPMRRADDEPLPVLPVPGEKARPKELRSLYSAMKEVFPRLERRVRGEEKPIELPWPHVARQFGGGLWPGAHILVGGTGTGKTQWALQVALHAAKQKIPALYVALELGELDLIARLLGLVAGRSWSDLYLGRGGEEKLASSRAQGESFRELPFYLEAGRPGAFASSQLEDLARSLRLKHPEKRDPKGDPIPGSSPFLLILDFLQIVGDESQVDKKARALELRERISRASYAARQIARDFDAAVLLVSSTARANYQKTSGGALGEAKLGFDEMGFGVIENPDALIGLGKESGDIEYAADTVTTLARWPEKLKEESPGEGKSAILVATAKLRAGPPQWSELRFNGSRFSAPADHGEALRQALAREAEERAVRKLLKTTEEAHAMNGARKPKGEEQW